MGSKGIGEIGIVGTAAAVANAVFNATGKRVRDLPIRLDRRARAVAPTAGPIAPAPRAGVASRRDASPPSRIPTGPPRSRRGDWERAREAFSAALEAEESGAAWEGLGWAAWWLSDEALTLRAREAAYRAYRAEGDDARRRPRRGLAVDRLPRVPRRGRGRARLAGARAPAARPAARVRRPRLAGAQRGLVRAQRRARRGGAPPSSRGSRRGSGASSASPTSRPSGSRSTGSPR